MAASSHALSVSVFAVTSRVIAIILQILFNLIISDHDPGVFTPPVSDYEVFNSLDQFTEFLLGGFRRWDGIYLLHVAEFGYTYENCLAFFPMYPSLVRTVANSLLLPLQLVMNYRSVILISGVLLNFCLFVQTAKNLFKLGQKVTNNDRIAYIGALLFCINPASIFMSAPYSEILFMYFSVLGILKLESNNKLSASICFGLSCITRSVGLLNIGYLLYKLMKQTIAILKTIKLGIFFDLSTFFTSIWVLFSRFFLPTILLTGICVTPFIGYQYYSYALYCEKSYKLEVPQHLRDFVQQRPYLKLYGDERSPWCDDTVPLAYSYIQKHYWEQGFLNYWKWKHVPNFLLAVPVTVLSLGAAVSYYIHNRYICWTLGLDEAGARKKRSSHGHTHYHLEGEKLLPYVIHAAVLTVFGWLFIHVQVLTRLLFASTPVLYWYAAFLLFPDTKIQEQTNKWDIRTSPKVQPEDMDNTSDWSNSLIEKMCNFKRLKTTERLIIMYFLGYYVIGIALFSNFLPWT